MNEARMADVARTQYGLITRRQLERLGFGRHAIAWKIADGSLEPVRRGVFRLRGSTPCWEQQALAAALALGPDAALSHRSAARIYGLDGLTPRDRTLLELSIPRERSAQLSGATVHRADPPEVSRWNRLPVTHLPRTLVDLASVLTAESLELAMDSAQRAFPALVQTLPAYVDGLEGGRPGLHVLRELLALRVCGPTDSALETRVQRRLRELRVPAWRTLFPVRDRGAFVAELDFAWVDEKVALHVDGYRWHSARKRFEKDARQRSALASLGWLSVVVTSKNFGAPEWVDNLLRALQFRAKQRTMF